MLHSQECFKTEAIAVSPLHPTPSSSYALHQPPEYMDICKLCCINRFFYGGFFFPPPEHLEYVEYVMCVVHLNVKQREIMSSMPEWFNIN